MSLRSRWSDHWANVFNCARPVNVPHIVTGHACSLMGLARACAQADRLSMLVASPRCKIPCVMQLPDTVGRNVAHCANANRHTAPRVPVYMQWTVFAWTPVHRLQERRKSACLSAAASLHTNIRRLLHRDRHELPGSHAVSISR